MCGRFATLSASELMLVRDWIKRANRGEVPGFLNTGFKANYDVRPTQAVPLIAMDGVEQMRWGVHPSSANRIIINATTEKKDGKFWNKAYRERRALIPYGNWFEWTGSAGSKQAHALRTTEPTALGALWFDDKEHGRSFAVMTAPAAKEIDWIHSRMPVLVAVSEWEAWLNPDKEPDDLATTYAGEISTFPCASPKATVVPVKSMP